METPVSDATDKGRRAILEALRDTLAAMIDGTQGHLRSCECECGTPADAKSIPALARELREVIAQLDDLPNEEGGSELGDIQAQREKRREAAQAARAAGTPSP